MFEVKTIFGEVVCRIEDVSDVTGAFKAMRQDGIRNFDHLDLSGVDLHGLSLEGISAVGARFCKANLSRANLWNANLQEADFREADLSEAYLNDAILKAARFGRADLRMASLSDARFYGAWIDNTTKLNWQSHDLLAEILRQRAYSNVERRSFAGLILMSRDWCWPNFRRIGDETYEWAMSVFAEYAKGHPAEMLPKTLCYWMNANKPPVPAFPEYAEPVLESVAS